ncbi:MAG TPA: hypothetical protein PLI34_20420, partial [Saprospiraceae bacterium]|nr:hypothetical protein [Saprospiraceae bacterium]
MRLNSALPTLLVVFSCLTFQAQHAAAAENVQYLKTKAQPGDGILSLMRRYLLEQHSCNFEQFYKLNNLKKNAPLLVGKDYTLP